MSEIKNYEDVWNRWYAFLTSDLKTRKEILDGLHIEVKANLEIITKLALEGTEANVTNKALLTKIKELYEPSLALAALSGYLLFLISENIDPVETNLIVQPETNELGNIWTDEYEKDEHKTWMLQIDPLLSLFLERYKQDAMNKLLLAHDELYQATYKDVASIDTFLNWVGHEGFIVAQLEQSLISKE